MICGSMVTGPRAAHKIHVASKNGENAINSACDGQQDERMDLHSRIDSTHRVDPSLE